MTHCRVPGVPNVHLEFPTYAAAFQCIGAACESHCCGEWNIPLDRSTYEKYRSFPQKKLGSVVSGSVALTLQNQSDEVFAIINLHPDSGSCPFLGDDLLCGIQKEYGPHLLSASCSIYPRSLSQVAGTLEGSLSLSCPEAARKVLLDPDFMQIKGDLFAGGFRTDNVFHLADQGLDSRKPPHLFPPIRQLIIDMIRTRNLPLSQRLLQVGRFCKEIEEIIAQDGDYSLSRIHDVYERISKDPSGAHEAVATPNEIQLRLDVIFALTNARIQDSPDSKLGEIFWTFVRGIASSGNDDSENDIDCFLQAERRYYRPFFETRPSILENYLLNYIFQQLFPYGRAGSSDFCPLSIFGEFLRMATRFGWIQTLLIGIAGHYKESFAEEHIVRTIYVFTRSIEHYPHMIDWVDRYIDSRGMSNLAGMSLLLKGNGT